MNRNYVLCHEICPWCGGMIECTRREFQSRDHPRETPVHTTHTHELTLAGKSVHYRTVGKAPNQYRIKMVFGFHEWAKKEDGLRYDPDPSKEVY